MIESADLWDYDVLSDMANIFANAFEACRTKYDEAGKLLFERAELAREQADVAQAHT
jgi:phage terminase Nu1 subunit (DNA packaging protein)